MAHTTIEQFATELKIPPGALLEQLGRAGLASKKAGDVLSEQDKTRLLDYLRKQHGAAIEPKKKITLTRKQTSEIKQAGTAGRARTIQVEVRKKRVFVKRDTPEPVPVEAPAPVVAPGRVFFRRAALRHKRPPAGCDTRSYSPPRATTRRITACHRLAGRPRVQLSRTHRMAAALLFVPSLLFR